MGKPILNVEEKLAIDCSQAYHEKTRGVVYIRGAPTNHPGFSEQVFVIQIRGCLEFFVEITHSLLNLGIVSRSQESMRQFKRMGV